MVGEPVGSVELGHGPNLALNRIDFVQMVHSGVLAVVGMLLVVEHTSTVMPIDMVRTGEAPANFGEEVDLCGGLSVRHYHCGRLYSSGFRVHGDRRDYRGCRGSIDFRDHRGCLDHHDLVGDCRDLNDYLSAIDYRDRLCCRDRCDCHDLYDHYDRLGLFDSYDHLGLFDRYDHLGLCDRNFGCFQAFDPFANRFACCSDFPFHFGYGKICQSYFDWCAQPPGFGVVGCWAGPSDFACLLCKLAPDGQLNRTLYSARWGREKERYFPL